MDNRTRAVLRAMRRILRVTESNSKALLRETGLSASQLVLLQILDDGGELTAGELATRMGITQATTTALIQKLENRGLITRRKGETDRRQVWLSLSDAGQQILARAPDAVHDKFQQRFAELEDWEQAMLIASLERISDMLGAADLDVAPVFDAASLDHAP
ncbi:MarR family winged helix-turn-helix transcriptional regulator [Cucumibacter marinus]|uniref:MarR family winged helix-turn-helix transcriptional regulator n=1 Tax=Cucumibacter marinus TaxID=1121252 RepID=UPI0004113BE4|nr:MarR family transcriptional regulator [Cucumibacter marinus]